MHKALCGICLAGLLAVSMTLVACESGQPSQAAREIPAPTATNEVVDAPQDIDDRTDAGTQASQIEEAWDTTPDAGKAHLRGVIIIEQPSILLGELYLAKAVPTSRPGFDVLELDTNTAPRAEIERESGVFLFANAEPGKYGLIVWEPMNSAPVSAPDSGATLFLELAAGERLDIGTLSVP